MIKSLGDLHSMMRQLQVSTTSSVCLAMTELTIARALGRREAAVFPPKH